MQSPTNCLPASSGIRSTSTTIRRFALIHVYNTLGSGGVHSSSGKLCRGRRSYVPLCLLRGDAPLVVHQRRKVIYRALTPPGYKEEYLIGVRLTKTGKLMGFVSAIPQVISVRGKLVNMVDVGNRAWFLSIGKLPLRPQEDPQQAFGSCAY